LSPRDESEAEQKLKKKTKKDKTKRSRKLDPNGKNLSQLPKKETEEEYDARLEREENERLAEEKRRELARTAERLARIAPKEGNGGVIYKGRGRMKFIDPESQFYRETN
jgi:peptidyl-prolyl isomerase G (cyclophilin G)